MEGVFSGIDWKQVRKEAGLPPGSEKALIEGYFLALKEPPPDTAFFTVDSLAAALHAINDDGCRGPYADCDIRAQFTDEAAAIIQAAKEAECE
jgi:hypothetical protein